MLRVDEVAFFARRRDTNAKTFEVTVADIVGGLARFKGVDAALVEQYSRHGLFLRQSVAAGAETLNESARSGNYERNKQPYINTLAPKVRQMVWVNMFPNSAVVSRIISPGISRFML